MAIYGLAKLLSNLHRKGWAPFLSRNEAKLKVVGPNGEKKRKAKEEPPSFEEEEELRRDEEEKKESLGAKGSDKETFQAAAKGITVDTGNKYISYFE